MNFEYRTYSDGGARGNPGPAGIGAVIKKINDGQESTEKELKEYIGEATNNQAEYRAVIMAIEYLVEIGAKRVECVLDSELVVRQLKQEYKVKDSELAKLFLKVWNLMTKLEKVEFRHVRREYNKEADRLVNEAIDEEIKKQA